MKECEEYLIKLISSHMNSAEPPVFYDVDWEEIYRLADINDIAGIVAAQIKKLPKEARPDSETASLFNQQLGLTVIGYDERINAQKETEGLLRDNSVDYILVKGSVIRDYYPEKELRTSGDTDVIIRQEDIDRCLEAVINSGYKPVEAKATYFSFRINTQLIEIHSNENYDNKYFEQIFELCEHDGCRYFLDDYEHLLYIICHMVKHFRLFGAGIRMFTDVDAVVRHIDGFDCDKFTAKCDELNLGTFARAVLSICNYWFDTPVRAEIDFESDVEFRSLFEEEILRGGSFGSENKGLSDYYLNKSSNQSKSYAILHMVFPDKKYLYDNYPYAKKHRILLPAAWLNRLFRGAFLRGKKSVSTVNGILSGSSAQYKKLMNELEI